jgi:hypothetical protein
MQTSPAPWRCFIWPETGDTDALLAAFFGVCWPVALATPRLGNPCGPGTNGVRKGW